MHNNGTAYLPDFTDNSSKANSNTDLKSTTTIPGRYVRFMFIITYEESRTAKSCSILLNFLAKVNIIKKETISQIYGCRTLPNICDRGFKVNKRSTNKTCSAVHGFCNNTLYCCVNNSVYEMQKQPFADVLQSRCS